MDATRQVLLGGSVTPRKVTPSLTEAYEIFRADRERRRYATSTLRDYDVVLRRLIKETKNARTGKIDQFMITDFMTSWAVSNDLRPSTVAKNAARLHAFGRFCYDRGWTSLADWTQDLSISQVGYRQTFTRLPADKLTQILTTELHPRDRALAVFAGFTGLRISEIVRLKISDLDLSNNLVRVMRSKKRGSSAYEWFPLTTELVEAVVVWLDIYREECGALQPEWYLIPTRGRGHGPLDPTNAITHTTQNNIAKRVFRMAGIEVEKGEAWHVFRRSMARLYYDSLAGESGSYNPQALRRVQALLGHTNVSTTEAYLGLDVDRAARNADLAGRSFLSLVP